MTDNFLQLRAFLADQTTMTMATIGSDGAPQAADLYYVHYAETDDLRLYFISVPGSRHAHYLACDARVAVTIHAPATRWRDIRGVQLEGTCVRVVDAERAAAWARYTAKFPFVLADAALAGTLQKVTMYRITPHWLRWIDNAADLGHNPEWRKANGEWQAAISTQPQTAGS